MIDLELMKIGYKPEEQEFFGRKLCYWNYQRFPGANPVSFQYESMYNLQRVETIVCEKTDGVRFFLVEVIFQKKAYWFTIDRQFTFR